MCDPHYQKPVTIQTALIPEDNSVPPSLLNKWNNQY